MRLFDLSGRVALVTGGNGGIGLGMAEGLAAAGAKVMIAGRNEEKNEAAVKVLKQSGAVANAVQINVNEQASCNAMVSATVKEFGGLHILVNNAGINIRKQPQEYEISEWEAVLQTNLTAAFMASQASYSHMVAAGSGKIINIGSMLSIFGARFAAAYAASKGGIVQMTKSLACAWAPDHIQVNAVLPGWIDTALTRQARDQMPGMHERIEARTPAGRWGTPEDHAGIAVFLASPASDFLTGTAIPLDGGYSVQGV